MHKSLLFDESPVRTQVYNDREVEFDLASLEAIPATLMLQVFQESDSENEELIQIEANVLTEDWRFSEEVCSTKQVPHAPLLMSRVLSPEMIPLNRQAKA